MENEIREDKFIAKEGELTAIISNCKSCVFCVIDKGLSCNLYNTIPMDVRLNKKSCKDYKKLD